MDASRLFLEVRLNCFCNGLVEMAVHETIVQGKEGPWTTKAPGPKTGVKQMSDMGSDLRQYIGCNEAWAHYVRKGIMVNKEFSSVY